MKSKLNKHGGKKRSKFIYYGSIGFMSLTLGLILIVIGLVFDFNNILNALFIGTGGLLILLWKIIDYSGRNLIYGKS